MLHDKMARGSMARRHQSVFGVVFLVFLIPVVLTEAHPPLHTSLPYKLLSELFQPNAAPPRRVIHAPVSLFPELSPHQDQAPPVKEGTHAAGMAEVQRQLDLVSKWSAGQQTGCHRDEKEPTQVSCVGASVTAVPADLGNGTTLIWFQDTSITEIPNGAFLNYTDLLIIAIIMSPLARVEAGAFRGVSKLCELHVLLNTQDTATTFENSTFEAVSSLETVLLYNIGLKVMPEYLLKNATNVTSLDLSSNHLTRIDAMAPSLQKLEKLQLQDNEISTIEPSAFNFTPGIKWLELSSNSLGVFDASLIGDLMSLSTLYLDHNKLTTVNGNLCNRSTALTDLHLEMNELTDVISFNGCSSLENLDISNNFIKTLHPQAFTKMDHLKSLKLAGNQLDIIPNLGQIPQLESLDISGNIIPTIRQEDFNKLDNLTTLKACGMRTNLTVEREALNLRLQDIDFSLNPAINITTETLLSPPSVQNIDLHGCGIEVLNGTAIMNKDSLKTLDISSNPLICDCDARWLPKSRDMKKPWAIAWGNSTTSPECGTPGWLPFGILTIPQMTVEDFACEIPKVDLLNPTSITVDWNADFKLAANLTRGYPTGKWTLPPGGFSNSVGDINYYAQHFTQTYAEVYNSNFRGTVNFTMVASNLVGDTKVIFSVIQKPGPPSGASKGGPLNNVFFVIMMITALLLKA